VLGVTCDIRDADQVAFAFDEAAATFGLPDVLINNAAANFPVPAEDMSPNAWRTVVRHHPQRHFLLLPRIRPASHRSRNGRVHRQRRRVLCLDGRPWFRSLSRCQSGVKNMVETLAVEWGHTASR